MIRKINRRRSARSGESVSERRNRSKMGSQFDKPTSCSSSSSSRKRTRMRRMTRKRKNGSVGGRGRSGS